MKLYYNLESLCLYKMLAISHNYSIIFIRTVHSSNRLHMDDDPIFVILLSCFTE